MKKLINHPKAVVQEMLEGLVMINPSQCLLVNENVVIRADQTPLTKRQEVAIISGGGSGHEPAHAGFVGKGMLHAAVAGEIFASPSPDAILAAIRAVASPLGVLLIVKNYTGDRLNFGLAAELARIEGIAVEMVMCGDDVSLGDADSFVGRRGIAGTVLVHKIAGAVAATGASLAEVKQAALSAAREVGSMGVALSPCVVPAAGRASFDLGSDEIEFGLGIHGEAGVKKMTIQSADQIVDHLLAHIIKVQKLSTGDRVVLLVNNLGSTPLMELGIIAKRAMSVLTEQGIVVERAWAGTFLTALEMAGCSLSLLKVDDQRLAWIDAPTEAAAWPNACFQTRLSGRDYKIFSPKNTETQRGTEAVSPMLVPIHAAISAIADALEAAEPHLTELDRLVGDGDLGHSLARAAIAIREVLEISAIQNESELLSKLGAAVRREIGGTSGPLYAIFLIRAARSLSHVKGTATPADWSAAFSDGCAAISELGGAKLGDRTMLDALLPAANAFSQALNTGIQFSQAWVQAVQAAEEGAKQTASMFPRLGRSSYLGDRVLGIPDPGATAVSIWVKALSAFL